MRVEPTLRRLCGDGLIRRRVLLAGATTVGVLVLQAPPALLVAIAMLVVPLATLEVASVRRRRRQVAAEDPVLAA